MSGSGLVSSSEGGGVVSGTMCVEQRRILETVTVYMTPSRTVNVEDIVINLQWVGDQGAGGSAVERLDIVLKE